MFDWFSEKLFGFCENQLNRNNMIDLDSNPLKKPGYKKIILEYAGNKILAYYYPQGRYIYFKFSFSTSNKIGWKKQNKKDTGELFSGKRLRS